MTNIAMENPPIFNRRAIYKWAIYTMAMLNNQRVYRFTEFNSVWPFQVGNMIMKHGFLGTIFRQSHMLYIH